MQWNQAVGACGYKISAGTSPGATDIVNNFDVGLTHVYNFAGDLPTNSPIHITVTPYFDDGDFTCSEESFITGTSSTVPLCTMLTKDLGGATDIPVGADLTWLEASGADGYRITVGTTSGGNDVIDNLDVGNTTSYDFPTDFALGTTVFATITPYNSVGSAMGCIAETFVIENQNTPSIPVCTTLQTPANGAIDVSTTTVFEFGTQLQMQLAIFFL